MTTVQSYPRTLYHVSEESGIRVFEPRPSVSSGYPVVWAIDARHLRNYLLPRDCPRVTFAATPCTTAADRERYLGGASAVVAIESAWETRVRTARVYSYALPSETFEPCDAAAGYFVSRHSVVPVRVDRIDDLPARLHRLGVELRVLPELWRLHDAVAASTLEFSMIRMRNAGPRDSV